VIGHMGRQGKGLLEGSNPGVLGIPLHAFPAHSILCRAY